MFSPIAATAIISLAGIEAVFMTDLFTFILAFLSLLVMIKIPHKQYVDEKANIIKESVKGLMFLKESKGLLHLIIYLAIINFIAAMAFFGVLPAMIMTRTSNNEA